MRFLGVFVEAILILLSVFQWTLLLWIILSWIVFFTRQSQWRWRNRGAYNIFEQLERIFGLFMHPLLRPFRRLLPPHKTAGVDWSPLLLWLAIYILRRLIVEGWAAILGR